jgi:hypothetical protein
MSRELSRREARLLMILPALLIAAGYLFFFEQPNSAALRRLEKSLAASTRTAVPAPRMEVAQRAVVLLEAQVKAGQHKTTDAHPTSALPAQWTTPLERLDALGAIASVFEAHSLVLIDSSQQPDADGHSVVPRPFQEYAKTLEREAHYAAPQVWRVEAVGSYVDVLAALQELGRRNSFIVPLAISMQTLPDDATRRRWSLWLWV